LVLVLLRDVLCDLSRNGILMTVGIDERDALRAENERLKHLVGFGVNREHKLRIEIAELQDELNKRTLERAELIADRERILAELVSVKGYAMGAVNVANRAIDARDDFSAENDAFNAGGTLKARSHP